MKVTYKLLIVAACCIPVQAFAIEKVSVSELLDKYAANQDRLASFIAKTEDVLSVQWLHKERPDFKRLASEFRVDGKSTHLLYYTWRNLPSIDANTPIEDARYWADLWDGKCSILYAYAKRMSTDDRSVVISTEERLAKHNMVVWYRGVPLLGIRYSDYEPIDSVLRRANSISIRDELEQLGSANCYVIDANTTSGTYTVWLDPQHGYQIARADIRVGPDNAFRRRPVKDNESDSLSVRNIRFEKIDGTWVPMEADIYVTSIRQRQDSSCKSTGHHKITQITINPDHEALGSFIPVVENGTEVYDRDSGAEYTWQDGKKFVVDERDGGIRYVPKEWSILVGVGKPLPQLEGIKLNLSSEQTKNRAILLCFFDMNQRSSRNCTTQLAQKAEELKEKGITVAFIQASEVDDKKLNEWTKANNIPLPVGTITADIEKTSFSWGVRALPWLILTDPNHFVTAESFTLDELYDKVRVVERPSVSDLLDRYAANQDKLKSFIVKTESVEERKFQRLIEFRYEDSGSSPPAYYYGFKDFNLADSGGWVPEDRYTTYLWDGKLNYQYSNRANGSGSSTVHIIMGYDYAMHGIGVMYRGAGPILGILYGDVERFDSILRRSSTISVRSKLERVGSVDCYVIDANSSTHGSYTVWLDPEHGYCVAKATVHKGPEDLLHGRPPSSYINTSSYKGQSFFLENVRFENIKGIWIPVEADTRMVDKQEFGTSSSYLHYKITQMDINPDHTRLRSFIPDIQEGRPVSIGRGPEYKWQDGMKFVADERYKCVRYVPKEWSILVNTGKPLPKFEGIELNLSAEQTSNRAILLCFFDMEQRPSRHYIKQLVQKAAELKEKGVTVAAVYASQASEKMLNEWIEKYDIPFTVGAITADTEKTRFAWGLYALPRLILTDKQHIVTAEGFAPTELDEKLGKNSKH